MAQTDTPELLYVSIPINKWEPADGGGIYVYGKATDGSVDSDRQIVDSAWSAEALRKWMSSGPNVRLMHNPKLLPAGSGVELEVDRDGDGGHWVKSKIDEPNAVNLVKNGHLRAYSVGISRPVIERDITGKAPGGIIKGNDLTEICELSLVDRPANRQCGITLVKTATGTSADDVWTYGDLEDLLLKSAEVAEEPVQDAEPADAVPLSGRDLWLTEKSAWIAAEPLVDKAHSGTDYLIARSAWQKWVNQGEDLGFDQDGSDSYFQWVAKRKFDPNVGGGTDRDKIPAEDFAGKDRSFPIVTPQDVADAATSIGRAGDSNYSSDQLKANIIRIAKRKGPQFEAKLPEAWKMVEADVEKAKPKKGKKPAFNGAAKPFGSSDDADDADGKPDNADAKKGAKDCPKCGHDYDADSPAKRCESCGTKLKATSKCVDIGATLKAVAGGFMTIDQARAELDGITKKKKSMPTSVKPAGTHREPDGTSTVEQLEPQAGMSTTPDAVPDQVPASVKSQGPSYGTQRMHDALCAAYAENSIKTVYPSLDTIADAIDPNFWRDAAAEAERAGKAKKTARLRTLASTAQAVKSVDPALLSDARAELSKMFMDSYPNINLTPAAPPQPGQFRRPFIGTGHALMKPSGSPRLPSATHVPDPDDFDRSALTAGQERPSPGNKSNNLATSTVSTGAARSYYASASREAALNAIQSMHDHIATCYPDMCAMAPSGKSVPSGMNSTASPAPVSPPNQGSSPGEKAAVDPQLIKSLVAEEIASLRGEYETKISKMQTEIDTLGSQADLTQAPVRGAARKAAEPVSPVEKAATAPDIEAQDNARLIAYLLKARDYAELPLDRERARAALEKMITS